MQNAIQLVVGVSGDSTEIGFGEGYGAISPNFVTLSTGESHSIKTYHANTTGGYNQDEVQLYLNSSNPNGHVVLDIKDESGQVLGTTPFTFNSIGEGNVQVKSAYDAIVSNTSRILMLEDAPFQLTHQLLIGHEPVQGYYGYVRDFGAGTLIPDTMTTGDQTQPNVIINELSTSEDPNDSEVNIRIDRSLPSFNEQIVLQFADGTLQDLGVCIFKFAGTTAVRVENKALADYLRSNVGAFTYIRNFS